jgi:Flp pilus assembly protein TadD
MEYSADEARLYALAQERSRNNDIAGVVEVLRKLVGLRPDSALFNATLANALNTLGEVDEAERLFKQAVSLSPRSEKVSLGLFHCLWGRGKQDEALEEMKRFLSLADSDEYRLILAAVSNSLKDSRP